jgi:photosystem II stability/assembly factor-like uncharacterized protein
MFRTIILNSCCILLFGLPLSGQSIKILQSTSEISLRGMSVVNDKVIWVSGSSGKVARSIDGGVTWNWFTVQGYEKTDFRDIEAFSSSTALIMGITEPAVILKTVDGGQNWKLVYENKNSGMFFDAMDFSDRKTGVVVGDPIQGGFFIAKTMDGGNSWEDNLFNKPVADSGEACFASSGTNIRMIAKNDFYFISGGLHSNLIHGYQKQQLPIVQGKETTGANSIAFKNVETFVIVGGDFTTKDSTIDNCIYTFDGGNTWLFPSVPPHGYRSCVEYLYGSSWICCGLNGVDLSTDNGKTWTLISKESFHVCRKAKKGKKVFLSGANGNIGVLEYN